MAQSRKEKIFPADRNHFARHFNIKVPGLINKMRKITRFRAAWGLAWDLGEYFFLFFILRKHQSDCGNRDSLCQHIPTGQ